MKPKALFREYLNQRISREELRLRLAKDHSRGGQATLEILKMEESCRNILEGLGPAADVPERLVEKIVAVESWVQGPDCKQKRESCKGWLFSPFTLLDVVGHSKSETMKIGNKEGSKSRTTKKPGTRSKTPSKVLKNKG